MAEAFRYDAWSALLADIVTADGKVERDVLQVVFTGTVNHEPVGAHTRPIVRAPANTSRPWPRCASAQ